MSWLVLVIALLSKLSLIYGTCPDGVYDLNGQRCCTECPAGLGVSTQCSPENDTVCAHCVSGVSYSANSSHLMTCQNCTSCPHNSYLTRACNVTHDSVCECGKDTFFSPETRECNLCDTCRVGYGTSIVCTHDKNTVCEVCQNGTFSGEYSGLRKCLPCTVCKDTQKLLQTCSSTQDTICLSVPIYRSNNGGQHDGRYYITNVPVQREHKSREKDIDIIPLYCAILGAVVVGLLGYVILVHYRRMKEKRLVREPHEDVEYSKASGGDSGIYVEVEHQQKGTNCAIVTGSTRIRDLPLSKKRELERCFSQTSNPEDWKCLAKEIGFNARKISGFESMSKQDSLVPVRHLIHEWGRTDSATVGALIQALKNLGRLDILHNMQFADSGELRPPYPQPLSQQFVL